MPKYWYVGRVDNKLLTGPTGTRYREINKCRFKTKKAAVDFIENLKKIIPDEVLKGQIYLDPPSFK